MRSRAVNRPFRAGSQCLAPPPSQIFSPSLRTCDIRSARKRILASKRGEVGSTFVVSTLPVEEAFTARDSLRSAMDSDRTFYGIPAGQNGAMQRTPEELKWNSKPAPANGLRDWIVGNRVDQAELERTRRMTFSAATNNSRARTLPIRRGRRCVPPQPVISPSAAPRWPNTACGEAMRYLAGQS